MRIPNVRGRHLLVEMTADKQTNSRTLPESHTVLPRSWGLWGVGVAISWGQWSWQDHDGQCCRQACSQEGAAHQLSLPGQQ